MKFAFLIHPISAESGPLMELDHRGVLQELWGVDPLALCAQLHDAVNDARATRAAGRPLQARVVDELHGMASPLGGVADGRLYEIPMDAVAIPLPTPDMTPPITNINLRFFFAMPVTRDAPIWSTV